MATIFTNGKNSAGPACGDWSQRGLDWQLIKPGNIWQIFTLENFHDSLADLGGYIRFMSFGFNSLGISASSHKKKAPPESPRLFDVHKEADISPELTSTSLSNFSWAQPHLRRSLWKEAGAACVSLGGDWWVSAALMVSAEANRCPTTRNPTEHEWYLHCLAPTALKSQFPPHQTCPCWATAVCQHSPALSCLLVSETWKTQDVIKRKQCLFPGCWFRRQSREIKQACSKKPESAIRWTEGGTITLLGSGSSESFAWITGLFPSDKQDRQQSHGCSQVRKTYFYVLSRKMELRYPPVISAPHV